MTKLKLSLWESSPSEILPEKKKKKILWLMVFLCGITIIPLTIKNFIFGHYFIAFSSTAFTIGLLINVFFIHFKSTTPIHYSILVSLLVIILLPTIYELGIMALFWVFPVTIALTFILPVKASYFFNIVIIIGAVLISFLKFNIDVTTRFTIALVFTLTMINLVLNTIKSLSEKLVEQSIKDHLTGALNRRQLLFHLNDCIEQKNRSDTDAVIILFDIDNFKTINDQLGHPVGDLVIKRISDIISISTRKTDLFFRIGGDEFLLLTRNTTLNEANFLAHKICLLINKEPLEENIQMSVSIGIANITKNSSTSFWMECADQALYQAKDAGRNCVKIYTAA